MKRDKISAKSIIGKSLTYYRDRGNKELTKNNLVMPFNEKLIRDVWAKGQVIGNNNPDEYRKDECGAWMYFSHYSNRNSQYGWEIDHIEFPRIGLEWDQAFLHSQDAKNFVETFFWSQVYFPAACDAVDVDRDRTRSAKDLSR